MRRRVLLALAFMALALLLMAYVTTVHSVSDANERRAQASARSLSHSYARELRSRLLAAESITRVAVGGDAGVAGHVLRQRLAHSDAIAGLMIADVTFDNLPVSLSAGDRLGLSTGQTLLRRGSREGLRDKLYMVRAVIAGGSTWRCWS